MQLIDCKAGDSQFLNRVLHRLVTKEGILPDQLLLHGVEKLGEHAVAWGGFADIWKGTVNGELVALKVLRLYGQPEEQKALINVCTSISCAESLGLIRSRHSAKRHWCGDC